MERIVWQACAIGCRLLTVELLNGFLVSGFEAIMIMVSCYACVLMIFICD